MKAELFPSKLPAMRINSRNAFTLIEILFVLAILTALFALTLPLFHKNIAAPRQAAAQLASALQMARQYAVEHGTFTRVVFSNEQLLADTGHKLANSYGLYTFFVPHTDSTNFSFAYVGEWIPLPCEPDWQHLENVNVFFTNASNFFNPTQYWRDNETNYFATSYCGSFYPTNFSQTPYPTSYALINDSGGTNKYFNTNGTPKFYDLSGVEFDSQGKPTFSGTNNLNIRLIDPQNTNNYFDVIVDRSSGMIQTKSP